MGRRDVGVLALGRFLAVERYCQSTQPSSTHHPVPSSGPDRGTTRRPAPHVFPAGGNASQRPDLRS
jgi:hypothetical protein